MRRDFRHRRAVLLLLVLLYGLFVFSRQGFGVNTSDTPASIEHHGRSDNIFPEVPFVDSSEQDPARYTWEYVFEKGSEDGSLKKQRASWGALRGQGPRAHLQDALRSDKSYVYTEAGWGYNNQVVELMNCKISALGARDMLTTVIYLGRLTKRIPILFPFNVVPGFHKTNQTTYKIPTSAVFDLSTLAGIVESPIVEAHEVKQVDKMPLWQQPTVYDGEFQQMNTSTNQRLPLGSLIPPEPPLDDHFGCHSFTLTARRETAGFFSLLGFREYPHLIFSTLSRRSAGR